MTDLQKLLPHLEKPSRYLGTEHNSVHKNLAEVEVRLALCFPDLYDLGLGNLGLHILYAILNKLPYVWAERVYSPAHDLEKLLRQQKKSLFALESRHPLAAFDGIGFTLQSELTFTNILNILDLSGIPLRTEHRSEGHPLTFAGGPAVFNPEPLVPFMDFFVMGDGEEVVLEIAEVLKQYKRKDERLKALASLEGIYVPALTPTMTLEDGSIIPTGVTIKKRLIKDLNGATFPVDYLVPFTEQVHDRVSLEVLRGCTQGCRFCQAGMTTRPVRERSIDNIDSLMERTLKATGYEEVSLVSLSTCDYSKVRQLVERAAARARPDRVSVSLPSLRLDSFSVELVDMVADSRRTGLTFAPEAASPRLRALINKWIPDEDLIEMSSEAFKRGWDHVKLYFMIGLPTERPDDIEAIGDLCNRVVAAGKKYNRKASVHTGVSTFVPKPLTPFQWAEQINEEQTEIRQRLLLNTIKHNKNIKFGRHNAFETFLEGLVSRSDRRAGDLIEAAFKRGARFDAWTEHINERAWKEAIEETGFDVNYALRERNLNEPLPWDIHDIFIPKQWFIDDWNRAMQLQYAQDCRHSKCHKCGVIDIHRPLCASMLRNSIAGTKEEKSWVRTPIPEYVEPTVVQRVRFKVGKEGDARFLGHLEVMNAWLRALRRAGIPVGYSQGFHAHPKVNFSMAVPVGEESVADYMDVMLTRSVSVNEALKALQQTAPKGLGVFEAVEVGIREPGVMGQVAGYTWELFVEVGLELKEKVDLLLLKEELVLLRRSKDGPPKPLNIRPLIDRLEVMETGLRFSSHSANGRYARPKEILELLEIPDALIRKVETRLV
jgi:radical SAM family uncharacterized protein/radical SAM-linked protein